MREAAKKAKGNIAAEAEAGDLRKGLVLRCTAYRETRLVAPSTLGEAGKHEPIVHLHVDEGLAVSGLPCPPQTSQKGNLNVDAVRPPGFREGGEREPQARRPRGTEACVSVRFGGQFRSGQTDKIPLEPQSS